MKTTRRSGILMHITSLPSDEGIGTLGRGAYEFGDFLKKTGTCIWQTLPIGPTGYGESPYQSTSTFAGNPMLIDLNALFEEGILDKRPPQNTPCAHVDYQAVREEKVPLLKRAFELSYEKLKPEISAFRQKNDWVEDYALFEAVREKFDFVKWSDWPDDGIKKREKKSLEKYSEELKEAVEFNVFNQFLFDRQWEKLKFYLNVNGIKLFGDMPIYVAEDSADTWVNPGLFRLDRDMRPVKVAGVPPDYFSADGQRWGNPCYDWRAHKKQGYSWWVKRMKGAAQRFDIVRIDHFIGFANYYSIPAECPTAREGKWKKGPGKDLFKAIKKGVPQLEIVAENLGVVNNRVKNLLKWTGYPGMNVLQFAFGADVTNGALPGNIKKQCFYYTGTHDNATTFEWWQSASKEEKSLAKKALGLKPGDDVVDRMILAVLFSRASTAIAPMQDFLGLGAEARMNTPGTVGGTNWRWRMSKDALTPELAARIKKLNKQGERGIK
ncbi:MAG: 4-alpha-glucanotransferase [Clostridia bacterium]|nr:4-alpha-glucanotransferase [Clostridia bacterium]